MCNRCGHDARHTNGCPIYVAGKGWCKCAETTFSRDGDVGPAIHIKGKATYLKMYADTKAFRDKAVHDAEAKARRI